MGGSVGLDEASKYERYHYIIIIITPVPKGASNVGRRAASRAVERHRRAAHSSAPSVSKGGMACGARARRGWWVLGVLLFCVVGGRRLCVCVPV